MEVSLASLDVIAAMAATGISASFGRPPIFRIAKGSLAPLKTMGRKYPVDLPPIEGEYTVHAKLNFRHLPPVLLDNIGACRVTSDYDADRLDALVGAAA